MRAATLRRGTRATPWLPEVACSQSRARLPPYSLRWPPSLVDDAGGLRFGRVTQGKGTAAAIKDEWSVSGLCRAHTTRGRSASPLIGRYWLGLVLTLFRRVSARQC